MSLSQQDIGQRLCVIVPCYNTKNALKQLLAHFSTLPDVSLSNVFVIDDGSSDGTAEMLRADFPSVRVVSGDGHLLWTGAIRLGMEEALKADYPYIFWLNHDCRPDPGAFAKIAMFLEDSQTGCVSGWCRIAGFPDYSVSPGFKNCKALRVEESGPETIPADGTNGNFVGFRADVVRRIGLPDQKHHPHYGDGPYTLRFSRAGFRVLVCKTARADLDYELERRLPPFWRVAVNPQPVTWWLRYYFLSFKSQYHLAYRWHDSFHLHGIWALVTYPKVELQTLAGILLGAMARGCKGIEEMRRRCLKSYAARWPKEKLEQELAELSPQ